MHSHCGDIHCEVKGTSEKRTEFGEGGPPEPGEAVAEKVEVEEESESNNGTESEEGGDLPNQEEEGAEE
ncbi:hypothetical protein U1Q18_051273 [Sarracenia purpurea var. burkii]